MAGRRGRQRRCGKTNQCVATLSSRRRVDGVEVDATISSQVKARLKPSAEALEAVIAFVKAMGGVPAVDKFESVVSTTVSAKTVEEHLETTLHHHGHTERNAQVIRAVKAYSLPADVAKHVSVVGDLVRFPRLKPAALVQEAHPTEAVDDDSAWTKCGSSYCGFVNPHVLAERYGFEFPKLTHAKGNSLGLAEFQRQYYDDPDLEAFTKACQLQTNVTVSKVEGGNDPKACSGGFQGCVESLLDIEYVAVWKSNSELGQPRVAGSYAPSSRRSYGDDVASMAWVASTFDVYAGTPGPSPAPYL